MRKLTAVVALTAVGIVALAGSASAASDTKDSSTGIVKVADATSYILPTDASMPVHVGLTYDQAVHVRCVTPGQTVNSNPLWYRIGVNGKMGFVPVGAVHTASKIPSCSMS